MLWGANLVPGLWGSGVLVRNSLDQWAQAQHVTQSRSGQVMIVEIEKGCHKLKNLMLLEVIHVENDRVKTQTWIQAGMESPKETGSFPLTNPGMIVISG